MSTIGTIIKVKQPKVYQRLIDMRDTKFPKEDSMKKRSLREVETLMRHDSYHRTRGGIRQVRRGS